MLKFIICPKSKCPRMFDVFIVKSDGKCFFIRIGEHSLGLFYYIWLFEALLIFMLITSFPGDCLMCFWIGLVALKESEILLGFNMVIYI